MKEFAKALAKVQTEIGTASKSSTNPHFKSRYADLAEVWATWQEVGPKHGFSVIQTTAIADGVTCLQTTLLHESGDSMTGIYPLMPSKNDPQGMGSAMTYARRYTLAAMVGIVQDDDDGNAASVHNKDAAKAAQKPAQTKDMTPEQKVAAWIEGSRKVISQMQTREQYKEWKEANKAALAKLASDYPDKHEALQVYIDGIYDNLAENF
jgi:hypothetical protein